jgi:hypothetical protein
LFNTIEAAEAKAVKMAERDTTKLADIICRLIYIKIMLRPKPNQLIKKQFDKDKWQRSFENQMVIAERNNIAKVKRYYRDNYNKGIDSFVSEGQTNFQLLFPTEQLSKMYRDMYADIGLQFANWYGKNYESLISKAFNPAEYQLQWEASFAALGSAVGAQRVTLVKGTALKTLQTHYSRSFIRSRVYGIRHSTKGADITQTNSIHILSIKPSDWSAQNQPMRLISQSVNQQKQYFRERY